ncbi:hypothetical protein PVAP13_5NG166700 [Panicum virgatum]|uniref:Uncharacterized protein n=1 Tax=Panicum virgatum TaxID=38727 RepID=A0A8T0RR14_PANVG|nr:hypothetical protein PVAP13_5NG166700 [Panicum virgatum]
MPRRGKSSKPTVPVGNAYAALPLPSGVHVPMCFCGNPCKVAESDEKDTYKQRYWMCANYAFDPPRRMIRIGLLTPPPLCDFEQWIDMEIIPEDKRYMELCKKWEAERLERVEKRRQEEVAEKERKEEMERRHAAELREDRERKLERARHVKAALEDNLDALRKGKWPRCTQ